MTQTDTFPKPFVSTTFEKTVEKITDIITILLVQTRIFIVMAFRWERTCKREKKKKEVS